MFWAIFQFEIKRHVRRVGFWVFFLILAVVVFLFAQNTDPHTTVLFPMGKEWHNAPLVVARVFANLSVLCLLFTVVLAARSVTRDFDTGIHPFFFTAPITKWAYLGGRLLSGLTANGLIYAGAVAGLVIGCLIIPAEHYGPFSLSAMLVATLVILVPNLLLMGSVFFCLATLTRKMVFTYVAAIAFITIYLTMTYGISFREYETFRILADPAAASSLTLVTKYWTQADINTRGVPLHPLLLLNRLIWLTVARLIFAWTYHRFSFSGSTRHSKTASRLPETATERVHATLTPFQGCPADHTAGGEFRKSLAWIVRDSRQIMFHPAFIILSLLAMQTIFMNFFFNVYAGGNNVYPLTSWFVTRLDTILIITIPIVVFFSGMLVWKERDEQSHAFYDTLPLSPWVGFSTKYCTMALILAVYLSVNVLTGVATQVMGFSWWDIQPGLYVKHVFGIHYLHYLHMALLALLIQTVSPNKYWGFFLSAAALVGQIMLFDGFSLDLPWLWYGRVPHFIYSDFNGFGHYVSLILWYSLYWIACGAIVAILTALLWRRSEDSALRTRLRLMRRHITNPQKLALTFLTLCVLVLCGHILINRHVINTYASEDQILAMHANYEKKYQSLASLPQPTPTHMTLRVDFLPQFRRVDISGHSLLENQTQVLIDEVLLNLPDTVITEIRDLHFEPEATLTDQGPEFGFRRYRLKKPLPPGESLRLVYDLTAQAHGFTDHDPKDALAANGTQIHISSVEGSAFFPMIGYRHAYELVDKEERRRFGLPERDRFPTLESASRTANDLDFHYITYDAVLSTIRSQVAVTNGSLQKQWIENDRNHFHYRAETPILDELVLVSGKYQVAVDDTGPVRLEVFYHEKHPWNIDAIMQGLHCGLDYNARNFAPYPYKSLRVIEVPNYMTAGAARSQPTTVVWRENEGFIHNLNQEHDTDWLLGITVHEVTHNWWPIMIPIANAEGAQLLSETMANYAWIMVLQHHWGRDMALRHLEQEMDAYLRRRKTDVVGERPMIRAHLDQSYLAYPKSTVVMYALQDALGEDVVNRALRQLLQKHQFRTDEQVLSTDLIAEFNSVTPKDYAYLIEDLFQTITLWNLQALESKAEPLDDETYSVHLKVDAHKVRADAVGNETETPMNDWINVGVYGQDDRLIYREKHRIQSGQQELTLIVHEKPSRAGIDPEGLLIDRNRSDNTTRCWL